MTESNRSYRPNLKQFANHKRYFPWKLLIKLIVGLGLIYFTYLIPEVFVEKERLNQKGSKDLEIEISND